MTPAAAAKNVDPTPDDLARVERVRALPNMHEIGKDNSGLNLLLLQFSNRTTPQDKVQDLCAQIFDELTRSMVETTFPKKYDFVATPMAAADTDHNLSAYVPDTETKVVICLMLRAGMFSGLAANERLKMYGFTPRIDVMGIERVADEGHHITGAKVSYAKTETLWGHYGLFPDPMAATGSSLTKALQDYQERGYRWPKKLICLHAIAHPMAIETVLEEFPEAEFYVGRIDPRLTEESYIDPGGGDLGKRLTGRE